MSKIPPSPKMAFLILFFHTFARVSYPLKVHDNNNSSNNNKYNNNNNNNNNTIKNNSTNSIEVRAASDNFSGKVTTKVLCL